MRDWDWGCYRSIIWYILSKDTVIWVCLCRRLLDSVVVMLVKVQSIRKTRNDFMCTHSRYFCTISWSTPCGSMMPHYDDVIMTTMAAQITSLTVVYSTVYSDANQREHQSSASLAFVWGIHRDRWIPRTKGQLRRKCFHLMTSSWFDDIDLDQYWLRLCLVAWRSPVIS